MRLMVDSSGCSATSRRQASPPSTPGRSRSTTFSLVCGAICCTLAVTACSSSNTPTTTGASATSGPPALVKFSACMRSHAVPDFPDPQHQPRTERVWHRRPQLQPPANLNPQSPAYESADKACGRLITPEAALPISSQPRPDKPRSPTQNACAGTASRTSPTPPSAPARRASRSVPAAGRSTPDHPPSNKPRRSANPADRAWPRPPIHQPQ